MILSRIEYTIPPSLPFHHIHPTHPSLIHPTCATPLHLTPPAPLPHPSRTATPHRQSQQIPDSLAMQSIRSYMPTRMRDPSCHCTGNDVQSPQPRWLEGFNCLHVAEFTSFAITPFTACRDDHKSKNIAALEEGRAALDQSLQAVNARLRQAQKTAWSRRKHELASMRRLVEQAVVVLLLHDTDRCWLPAFMRKHGMRDGHEELSAFDEEVVNHFLALSPEDMNAMRAPTDQKGRTRLRDAQAFITEHRLLAWVATHNERHGLAPTVGDALQHRDELAAAVQAKEMQPSPLWSVANSARYKWGARFRKKWRVGLKRSHA